MYFVWINSAIENFRINKFSNLTENSFDIVGSQSTCLKVLDLVSCNKFINLFLRNLLL